MRKYQRSRITRSSISVCQFNFFISRLKQDAMLTVKPHIPVHRNIAAMPFPALSPTIISNISASQCIHAHALGLDSDVTEHLLNCVCCNFYGFTWIRFITKQPLISNLHLIPHGNG